MWNVNLIFIFAATTFIISSTQASPNDSKTLLKELLVPFNDLLPPLLESETTKNTTEISKSAAIKTIIKTTTTTKAPLVTKITTQKTIRATISTTPRPKKQIATHAPPALFKTTKKSYYQQQTEHIKELHLIDDEKLVPHDYREQAEHLQHLHAAVDNDDIQQQQQLQRQQQLLQQQQQQQQQKLQQKLKLEQAQSLKLLKQQQQQKKQKTFTQTKPKALIRNNNQQATQQQQHLNQRAQVKPAAFSQKPAKPLVKLAAAPPQLQQPQQQFEAQAEVLNEELIQQLQNVVAIPAQQHVATISQPIQTRVFNQQSAALRQQPTTINAQQKQQHQQQHRFNLQQIYRDSAQSSLSLDALHHYIDYQYQTTHRPPKAGLPTLTPFPRHLK